jgi:hypothetical protein
MASPRPKNSQPKKEKGVVLMDDLHHRLIQEAQGWKMEAAAHKSIVLEIYQALGIQKGTWNGSSPVIEKLDELTAMLLCCDMVVNDYISKNGLCDRVNSLSEPYKSQHLENIINTMKTRGAAGSFRVVRRSRLPNEHAGPSG